MLRAKSAYNTTLSNVNLAEESYNAAVQKLEDTFETLKDAKRKQMKTCQPLNLVSVMGTYTRNKVEALCH